jgi:hypothetical protein
VPCRGLEAGTTPRALDLRARHREATRSCEGQRRRDMTSRVPELGKPGSVGALGSNPQGDPACVRKSSRKEEVPRNTETFHRNPAG